MTIEPGVVADDPVCHGLCEAQPAPSRLAAKRYVRRKKRMKRALIVSWAAILVGCGPSNYESNTTIGTTTVIARLHHTHPYLAEYKKDVEVLHPGAASVREELFPDSGGYSWIALYKSNNELIIQDFGSDSVVVDLATGTARIVTSLKRQSEGYVGRFDFDKSKGRVYRFIGVEEQTFDAVRASKGGGTPNQAL